MKTLQKSGGIAALYMAISHLIGLIIFVVVLDYINITDPMQKLAMNIEKQSVIFSTNLLMYVFFGFALIVLSLALYDRLKSGAPALIQVATAIGIIWAGSVLRPSWNVIHDSLPAAISSLHRPRLRILQRHRPASGRSPSTCSSSPSAHKPRRPWLRAPGRVRS